MIRRPRDDRRSLRTTVQRIASYLPVVRSAMHPRYAFAFGVSRLLPMYSAGPLIVWMYRLAGFSIGRGSSFFGPLRIVGGCRLQQHLEIKSGVIISADVTINVDGPVTLGHNVSIGPHVRIYTGTHANGPSARRMLPGVLNLPVSIGDGAWIRLGAIILPGVTIGAGAIVGAGAVVMSDVEPDCYVEGNPARLTRSLGTRYEHRDPTAKT